MTNFTDEVLNTGATGNKVKYKITHADSTEEIVEIELATPVTTEGTPLNKATLEAMQKNESDSFTISIPAGTAGGGDNTTTYQIQTTGKRYIIFTVNANPTGNAGYGSDLALLDCKTNTFIFNTRIARYMDYADNSFQYNVSQAIVMSRDNTNVKVSATMDATTGILTVTAIRHNTSTYGTRAVTLIGRELGGYIA